MKNLRRFAWLSMAAAVATITLKSCAFLLTGSVGLLSDAMESVINLITAVTALFVLLIAVRPPDERHAYGHTKVEYFAAGFVGALILVASAAIGWTSIQRLWAPVPLGDVGAGLLVALLAGLLNFSVARLLAAAGREADSLTLKAEAKHLMVDVWTSIGVIAGVGAVWLTGWQTLDPLIAILIACNIIRSGWELLSTAFHGLMDAALPPAEQAALHEVLQRYPEAEFQALRTRQAGAGRFVSMHVLVPGEWTVTRAHELVERVEQDLRAVLARVDITAHIEPKAGGSSGAGGA